MFLYRVVKCHVSFQSRYFLLLDRGVAMHYGHYRLRLRNGGGGGGGGGVRQRPSSILWFVGSCSSIEVLITSLIYLLLL